MTPYRIKIAIKDGEVEQIMKELDAAQEKIVECYDRLIALGVVVVEKERATSNETGSPEG